MPRSRTSTLLISGLPILSSLAVVLTILTPALMCLAGVAMILALLIQQTVTFSFVIPLKLFLFLLQ
jgi:hypothetical protein